MTSFFINCFACIYVYAYIFLNITYSVCIMWQVCVCVFKVGHLTLDNQLLCTYLRKTISPTLSIPWLPVALCVGLKSWDWRRTYNHFAKPVQSLTTFSIFIFMPTYKCIPHPSSGKLPFTTDGDRNPQKAGLWSSVPVDTSTKHSCT